MSTFSTYDSTVNSFYLAFYGRPADPAGLKFWSQQLVNQGGDLGAITQAFATSEEAQVRFGTDSVGDRIAEVYQQLFNRAPDATGLAYWTDVVAKGNASLADVAVAIMTGAQGSDARLSELRQQAADAFTATVEAGGTEYSGYASIEAARILVRAVTPGATQADLGQLVKAVVSFADTATKTPQVVEAIAVNTTLLALFDTARGGKEPVALANALADTAKAAAGDPVTLESLLRGGGMDKVLKVMPAKATLKDVVEALAKGGLPAAVEVVYPSAPVAPTPAPAPEKTFIVGGLEHVLTISGTATDNVIVDLTTNTVLRNGHNPMGSMNDITSVFAKDYAGKVTVTGKVAEIFVALGDADTNGVNGYGLIDVKSAIFSGEPGARKFISHEINALFERVNLVRLMDTLSMEERALFDSLQGFDFSKLAVEVDEQAPAMPVIALAVDDGLSPDDGLTSVAKLTITGLDKDSGTTWQYSIDNGVTWKNGGENDDSGKAELDLSQMHVEGTRLQVRQLDAAGNAGPASLPVTFTIIPAPQETTQPLPSKDGFVLGGIMHTLSIYGASTDKVTVDLTHNTIAREGALEIQYPMDIQSVYAKDYAGSVTLIGTAAEIAFAQPSFVNSKIAAYGIVDARNAIFTGAPGERSFISSDIQRLIDGAGSVKLSDMLSAQEWKLLDDLADFDMATLDAQVEPSTTPETPPETTTPDTPPETTTPDTPPPAPGLPFKVIATADGVRIDSTVEGSLRLSGAGSASIKTLDPSGKVIVGETDIGAQPAVLSGTFVLVPKGALPLRDDSGIVYTLGTVADDVIENADYAWGFDGADRISGTAGNNRLYGSAGDDTLSGLDGDDYLDGGAGNDLLFGGAGSNTIVGGLGGDYIISIGDDTLVYRTGAESNAGNLHDKSNPLKSADMVHALTAQKVTFDLGFAVSNVKTGLMPTTQADSPEAMFALLTQAYQDAGASGSDVAVLSTASSTQKLLLVDNGDGKIDANDIAVVLVGSGDFSVDSNGNVTYYNLPV